MGGLAGSRHDSVRHVFLASTLFTKATLLEWCPKLGPSRLSYHFNNIRHGNDNTNSNGTKKRHNFNKRKVVVSSPLLLLLLLLLLLFLLQRDDCQRRPLCNLINNGFGNTVYGSFEAASGGERATYLTLPSIVFKEPVVAGLLLQELLDGNTGLEELYLYLHCIIILGPSGALGLWQGLLTRK